jgi:hypothetical protein
VVRRPVLVPSPYAYQKASWLVPAVQAGTKVDVDGRVVPVLIDKMAGPGETIEVAAHEVPHLIATDRR